MDKYYVILDDGAINVRVVARCHTLDQAVLDAKSRNAKALALESSARYRVVHIPW